MSGHAHRVIKRTTALSPRPITLAVYCECCTGAVELQFVDWREEAVSVSQAWSCPYCRADNVGAFSGQLTWAAVRSDGHGTRGSRLAH